MYVLVRSTAYLCIMFTDDCTATQVNIPIERVRVESDSGRTGADKLADVLYRLSVSNRYASALEHFQFIFF